MSKSISLHVDIEGDIRQEEAQRPGSTGPDAHIAADEIPQELGPQQVEALLEYQLDDWMEKRLADAGDIADAMRHLDLHRIIGKKKKVIYPSKRSKKGGKGQ
jgi:hypothetical protein